jgi:DNA-binding GntR family transcriptional regulator
LKQASLSQQAYDCIKQKIVSLELPPGAVINEGRLREELKLGRTPIREALKQLALEKLVTIVPRRGMFVTDIRINDLGRLFEVRLELESLAARLAAERGSMAAWKRMEQALSTLDEERADNETLIAIDQDCHKIIYEAANNVFLHDTLVTYYAHSLRLWYYFLADLADMTTAIIEHRRILDALRAGQPERAGRLMAGHIQAFHDEIQAVMLGSVVAGTAPA